LYYVAFLVALGPTWLFYKYFSGPHLQSQRLQRILASRGNVTVSQDFVVLPGQGAREISLHWSRIKVVEHASLFLLVPSPLFAYYVPKVAMPAAVVQALQIRSARGTA